MIFLVLIEILRVWYNNIFFPVVMNPYTYILLFFWVFILGVFTYSFFYKIDRYRMQYIYKDIAVAILKASVCGLLLTTVAIAVYDYVLIIMSESLFFIYQKTNLINMMRVHISEAANRRLFSLLFLGVTSLLSLYFILSCSYQLQDEKKWKIYVSLVFVCSVLFYLFCIVFGFV